MTDASTHARIRQLQDEIDRLALLVFEAKRQSDRIQAAADALGDPIFTSPDLSNFDLVPAIGAKSSRSEKSPKTRLRPRSSKSPISKHDLDPGRPVRSLPL